MKTNCILSALAAMLIATPAALGLAEERIGPDKDRSYPTHPQPSWPARMVELLRHDSRVYSIWVNGSENIYFRATPDEIGELITLFSKTRLRDHVVAIKKGKPSAKTLKGEMIGYNVHFHYLDGIALHMSRREGKAETYEPTLTIYVDAAADQALLREIPLPDNIILKSEIANWPKGKATQPKREVWHGEVRFEDGTPAADFENNVSTTVTLWEQGEEDGFNLGTVSHEGFWHAAFSAEEVANLKAGKLSLTLTVGNFLTKPRNDDLVLPLGKLALDRAKAQPVEVERPRFYFGRLLFEDGSPALLDPKPWPGAEISISWPYSGSVSIDEEGYFKVFFTPSQFEDMKARKVRKNIYIPDFDRKGTSTARFAFPATELSMDKEKAGEMRISKPVPKKKD